MTKLAVSKIVVLLKKNETFRYEANGNWQDTNFFFGQFSQGLMTKEFFILYKGYSKVIKIPLDTVKLIKVDDEIVFKYEIDIEKYLEERRTKTANKED